MREQTLDRLIRIGLAVVVLGVALLAAVEVFDLRGGEPSLVERQIELAEKAVREEPDEVGLRLRLAEIYRVDERRGDALEQYEAVLEVEDSQSTALLGKGEVLAEQGDGEEAAKAFREVVEASGGEEFAGVDPQLAAAYYGLGSVLLEQDKAKQAVGPLRKAVEIEPTDADALYQLGAAQLGAGAPGRAVEPLRQAVLFVPSGWCDPYERLAEAYGDLGRGPYARYATAMVDLCQERPAEAARLLRPLASGPVAVEAMMGLGMAAEAQSHRAAAARWYRRVLAVDGDNFNARSNLSRLTGGGSGATPLPPDHADTGGA
jgi:tetratricopeptide (TPR) repeat protein